MPDKASRLQPATGCFDELDCSSRRIKVWGWMLVPEAGLDRIRVILDGGAAGFAQSVARPDVAAAYPWIRHAGGAGFSFEDSFSGGQGRIDLIGERSGREAARMGAFFVSDLDSVAPQPPSDLSARSTGVGGRFFQLQGLRIFTDFYDQLKGRLPEGENARLLDWGCGCGRVTAHFVRCLQAQVIGADLDGEAVQWCRRSCPGGRFEQVSSQPPLPFEDASFEAVTACSVFTHLSERDQLRWLREMKRILVPGGWLLATTHGQFAYELRARSRPGRLRRLLSETRLEGIVDAGLDSAFDGIAPPGYYRNVYQSRDYTCQAWANGFEVADYIERGVNGFQDLVVLRSNAG